ncbi:MAG TPA: protein-glutamate O-methyltransferase CheR [Spirochaetia bacterium]|nr:protein-glutamate O-methyltransferase CheR [Spirochaetia bacterium]
MMEALGLGDTEFRQISSLVYSTFGINLTEQKRVLVAGRLTKRVRQLGLASFGDYVKVMMEDSSGKELSEMINRITTNHSFFFRENDHFEFLQQTVLPEIQSKISRDRTYPFRMWSAGCAAGEEVYTLAIVLREYFGDALEGIDLGILASDISLTVLNAAEKGIYPANRLQEVPPKLLSTYFRQIDSENFEIAERLRKRVMFKKLNLIAPSFPFKGKFDFVFCRNVMIYFDEPTRKQLVETLFRYVKPGGYLFIGHSESLRRETCPFRYIKPAIYQKDIADA